MEFRTSETTRAKVREWFRRNPEKTKLINRKNHLKGTYGLSLEEFENLLKQQDNKCAICHSELPKGKGTHIDHCHKTNTIRGILCNLCNGGLGRFRDNIQFLQNAISYLKRNNE